MGVDNELFKLPIAGDGHVIVAQPAEKVYLLTFQSPPDNRLTTVSNRQDSTDSELTPT